MPSYPLHPKYVPYTGRAYPAPPPAIPMPGTRTARTLHRPCVPCTPPFHLTPTRRTLHPTTIVPSTVNAYPAPAPRTLHPASPSHAHPAVPCTPTVLVPSTGTAYPTPGPRPSLSLLARVPCTPSGPTEPPRRARTKLRKPPAYPIPRTLHPRWSLGRWSPADVARAQPESVWPVR